MSDYIKRENALRVIADNNFSDEITLGRYDKIIGGIYDIPSEDVAPIVRCKDCKKWSELGNGTGTCKKLDNVMFWYGTDATDFCSFAKRRKR